MLHIITPLYRPENLEKIYESIPVESDICWHISKSNKREKLGNSFLSTDKNIFLYDVDCEDNEIYKKRNAVFESIKDGYFCFIDDDTIFHHGMYKVYKKCKEDDFLPYIGMLVGTQINHEGKIRLKPSKPIYCKIDTGNVLAHASCLQEIRWPSTHVVGKNDKDFLFWEAVYNFYHKNCKLTEEVISVYNKLRPTKK
jgi:hypothetical protein